MKLYFSPTSPFVRKITMMAIETSLEGDIEHIPVIAGPMGDVARFNPLGKIPTLILDDDTVLYDSPVICEYLDGLHSGKKMIPESGPDRWTVLRLQALADGAMDAGILRLYEARREDDERSQSWDDKQQLTHKQAFDAMDASIGLFKRDVDLAQITFCAALGWFDFRWASEVDWRADRPALADWYAGFSARPSAMASEPVDL